MTVLARCRAIAVVIVWAVLFASRLFQSCAAAQETPGTIAGNGTVSLSGSAQYNIPINVPSGTAGMAPKLFLSYDSNAGPSSTGLGWTLIGISTITLTNRTTFLDGHPGAIDFSSNGAFALDGVRLVPSLQGSNFFAKVVDDQTRVEAITNADGLTFIARTKAGLRMYYRARVKTADGGVFVWACDQVDDTFGNSIHFRYKDTGKGDWALERVDYTENLQQHLPAYASVEFTYTQTPATISFIGGQRIERSLVLTTIESKIQNERYRKYQLQYEETGRFGGRRLASVVETGSDLGSGDVRHRPTKFRYLDPTPSWQKQSNYELPEAFSAQATLSDGYRFIDLTGSGKPDIMYSANLGGRLIASTYRFENGQWAAKPDLALPTAVGGPSESDQGTIFFDVDGDGNKDLLITREPVGAEVKAYRLVNGTKWEKAPEFAFPTPLVVNGQVKAEAVAIKKLNGSSRLMTLSGDDSSVLLWYFNSGQWISEVVARNIQTPNSSRLVVQLADVACGGRDDLVIIDKSSGTIEVARLDEVGSLTTLNTRRVEHFDKQIKSVTKLHAGSCDHLVVRLIKDDKDSLVDLSWGATAALDLPPAQRSAIDISVFDGTVAGLYGANVNGGGNDELLVQFLDSPSNDFAAYQYNGASSQWVRDTSYDYVGMSDSRVGGSYITLPVLQQSGRADLILLPITANLSTFALLNQAPGWKRYNQFVPSIAFAQDKKDAIPLQFVDLNGDGLADLIGYHVDNNGVETKTAKLNTANGWVEDPRLALPDGAPLSRSKAGITGMLVDVTGHGVPDFMYAYGGTRIFRKNVPGNSDTVWVNDPALSYAPPEDFAADDLGDLGVRFFDVNGDGRVDLIVSRREADGSLHRAVYLNTGTGWALDTSGRFLPPVPFVSRYAGDVGYETPGAGSAYYRDLRVQLMDITGNGLLSIVFWYRFNPNPFGEVNRGCLNVAIDNPASTPAQPLPKIPPKIPVLGNCAGVFLNTGNGWQALPQEMLPPIAFDIDLTDKGTQIDFVDLNGDGLIDIVPSHRVGGQNIYGVYLNKGPGWLDPNDPVAKAYQLPVDALSNSSKGGGYRLVDLNGDGLIDLVFARPDAKGAYLNTGRGWSTRNDAFAPPEQLVDGDGNDLGVRFVDVDGNGLPDLLKSWKDKDGNAQKGAYLNIGSRADTLSEVTNGTGQRIEYTYRSLLTLRGGEAVGTQFYEPSPISDYPVISHVPTMYAVSMFSVIDGPSKRLDTSYRYSGFRFDVTSGSVLGFETRFASSFVDSIPNIEERVDLYQDFYRNGRSKQEISTFEARTLSDTKNDYEIIPTPGAGRLARVVLANTQSVNHDLTDAVISQTLETDTFDTYNNLVDSCIVYGDKSWMWTRNEFLPSQQNIDPNVWFIGRLTRADVTHANKNISAKCAAPGPTDHVSDYASNSSVFRYDEHTGVLVAATANIGDPLAVTTEYQHDRFGNVNASLRTATKEKPRSNFMEYDPQGRLVIAEIDSLGHRNTRKFHPILGLVTQVSDANGATGSTIYDAFGQEISSTNPSGLIKQVARDFGAGETVFGAEVALKITTTIDNLPPSRVWFDASGRTLRTFTVGFNNRNVLTDFEYDTLGRQVKSTFPYFEGDRQYETKTTYDLLNRPIHTSRPDGGFTNTNYNGLVTEVSELVRAPSGGILDVTSRKVIKDLKGRTIQTVDAGGGVVQFSYGPGDRLIKTTSPGGRTVELVYDGIGNRIDSIDSDLGHWQYRYDAFGSLVWQRDARGQTTTTEYDTEGRPLNRYAPDKQTTYVYDTGPFAVGRLSSVRGSDDYEETYSYDSIGRVTRKGSRVGREVYGISLTYDINNRIREVYYPGGFATFNKYDSLGFLADVSAKNPDSSLLQDRLPIWTANDRDQYGRITLETYGNGLKTKHAFSELAGFERDIRTTKEDGSDLSHLSLQYDLAGNLREKSEFGVRQEFTYDPLYRLKSWMVNSSSAGVYTFDSAGRIKSKSDTGTYSYVGGGPFGGVKSITTPNGAIEYFEYDANGNMTFGPKGHFTYDSANLVTQAYQSDEAWSAFDYAPDGSRYKMRSRDHAMFTETISSGSYEHIDEYFSHIGHPDITRNRIYIAADTGLVAILEEATAFDPFGGSFPANLRGKKEQFDKIADLSDVVHYVTKDEIGSITRVTDKHANIENAFAYDPWGKKCAFDGKNLSYQTANCLPFENMKSVGKTAEHTGGTFHRGFTGHEHLDNLDLIHMNGRVYDPTIARFLSADPQIQSPLYSQNYDRYNYVLNNPLRLVDPTGFGFWGDVWDGIKSIGQAIARPFEQAWHWLERHWQTVVVIAVAVVITVATGGIGGAILAGAISGGLNAALYGGDISDILRGAVIGAVVGAAFYGAGSLGMSVAQASGSQAAGLAVGTVAHGVVGGLQASMQGGNFWSGFGSAAVTKAFSPIVESEDNVAAQTVTAAAIGGTASVVGGGKFEDGAVTGAYSELMNGVAHNLENQWADDSYFHLNARLGMFNLDAFTVDLGVATYSDGVVTQDGVSERIRSVDVEPWGEEGPSVSGFKLGDDQYGMGLGVGGGLHAGPAAVAGGAEGFVLGGDGQAGAGVLFTKTVGLETTGVGVELSVQPQPGGATLRAVQSFENAIKNWMGYYRMCPQCP